MSASKDDPEEMKARPRRRYSDQERAEAMLVLAANGGNLSATAIDTGIPYHTLRHWAAGDRHPEAIQMAKEKMPPLADRLEEVVSLLAEGMDDPLKIQKAPLNQIAVALGILIDKVRLLRRPVRRVRLSGRLRGDPGPAHPDGQAGRDGRPPRVFGRPRISELERTSSFCSVVSAVPEVIPALGWWKAVDQSSDRTPQSLDGSFGGGSQQPLELGERVLDGIEVGTVRRQIEVVDPAAVEGRPYTRRLVRRQVVENDQVARSRLLGEDLFDVGGECVRIHGPVQHHRGNEPFGRQAAHEGGGFPVAVRHEIDQSLALWGVTVEPGHGRGEPGFVQEYQTLGLPFDDGVRPLLASFLDVRALLLGRS